MNDVRQAGQNAEPARAAPTAQTPLTPAPNLPLVASAQQPAQPRESPRSRDFDRADVPASTFATTRTAPRATPINAGIMKPQMPAPIASPAETEAKPMFAEADLAAIHETGRSAAAQTGQTQPNLPAAQRPDMPQIIARQLAEHAARAGDRPVELTLNPDELGRVRMQLTSADTGIIVQINAERPETLDLMRRHIDQLARDFAAMGYSDIGFEFGDGQPQGETAQDAPQHGSATGDTAQDDAPDAPVLTTAQGLDIKI